MFIWFLSCSAPQAKILSFLLLVHSFSLIKIMILQCNIPKNFMNIHGTFSRSDELSPCTSNFLHVESFTHPPPPRPILMGLKVPGLVHINKVENVVVFLKNIRFPLKFFRPKKIIMFLFKKVNPEPLW